MPELFDILQDLAGSAALELRPDGGWIEIPELDVVEMALRMTKAGALLSTITAVERADGETDLIYHYRSGSSTLNVKTCTRGGRAASIALACPAANWIEREIYDLYAVPFDGHPNPERLVRPPELPAGFFRRSRRSQTP